MRIAHAFVQKENWEMAIASAEKAVQLNPKSMTAWKVLCHVLAKAGRVPELLQTYRSMAFRGEIPREVVHANVRILEAANHPNASIVSTLNSCLGQSL